MTKKVCLLIDRLSSGGAEKMVANLSQSLVKKGYDVTTVIMRDDVAYDFEGEIFNFGKVKKDHSRLKAFQLFRNYFKAQNFDVILDHRVRMFWFKEFLFSKLVFRKFKVIYCVHHYILSLYFPKVSIPFLAKKTLVPNREIVAVSQLAQSEIKKQLNLNSDVIYNYPKSAVVKSIALGFKYIIAVGRLETIKQFDVLINCYGNSILKAQNIKLFIFGNGSQKDYLQELIVINKLQDFVILKDFDVNVAVYIKSAQALVMTSKSEGFPMVLVEAIQLKTPVISFDCKSGPSEIIEHEVNGVLVKDQDNNAMIKALNSMSDEAYYQKLLANLSTYNSPFTEERIIQQWVDKIEA
ncbi:glycosyltransferase [Winogradskyella sp.]|uniref:glycosyltransferase n=1 Tax=Winogradskyella sp. TaxID=1883156 RepID=UPI0035C87247